MGRRIGQIWDEVYTLGKVIKNTCFNLTDTSEHESEPAFMSAVNANADRMNGKIMSQVDKNTVVRSAYLFRKKYRPYLTLDEDGIVVKIEYLSRSFDA